MDTNWTNNKQDREHQLNWKYPCTADLLFVLFGSTALLMLNKQQFYLFSQIKTSQTRDQLSSDTSPRHMVTLIREREREREEIYDESVRGFTYVVGKFADSVTRFG